MGKTTTGGHPPRISKACAALLAGRGAGVFSHRPPRLHARTFQKTPRRFPPQQQASARTHASDAALFAARLSKPPASAQCVVPCALLAFARPILATCRYLRACPRPVVVQHGRRAFPCRPPSEPESGRTPIPLKGDASSMPTFGLPTPTPTPVPVSAGHGDTPLTIIIGLLVLIAADLVIYFIRRAQREQDK